MVSTNQVKNPLLTSVIFSLVTTRDVFLENSRRYINFFRGSHHETQKLKRTQPGYSYLHVTTLLTDIFYEIHVLCRICFNFLVRKI